MLNYAARRIIRFVLFFKVVLLVGSLSLLGYLVINTPPEIGTIVIFALSLFVFLATGMSFFLTTPRALLAALATSFLLFLKAVGLLSLLNIGLFIVFLVLLGLYLRKR